MSQVLPEDCGSTNCEFARAVSEGLESEEKFLSSQYFYDVHGDRLFRAIMATPEYYLTKAEIEIFNRLGSDIIAQFEPGADIIELGAGDGSKTRLLLAEHLQRRQFCYVPIDISKNSLAGLQQRMAEWLPGLDVMPVVGEYLEALDRLPPRRGQRVFMFLGSNIGNFTPAQAVGFLAEIRGHMAAQDRLFIGFDLKKDPHVILAAYNDAAGHTRAFNLNLLRRINRELDGNFDLEQFEHYPSYDPQTGACKSYLVSRRRQEVFFSKLDKKIQFSAGECIYMEISQKYSLAELRELAKKSGFLVQASFTDSRSYFADQVWQPAS